MHADPRPRAPDGAWWAFALGAGLALLALAAGAVSVWLGGPPGTAPVPEDVYRRDRIVGEPVVRVRLERGVEAATLAGGGGRLAAQAEGDSSAVELATPARVWAEGGSWWGAPGDEPAIRLGPADASLEIRRPATGAPMLALGDARLPGSLVLRRGGGGDRFDVVEHVPMELYLPGVLARELYAGWEPEAYRAQAIAARSYALHERQRRQSIGSHFDVESTTRDQAYGGTTDRRRAHDAVRDTAGVVLTWRGSVLRAYYSSTVGGRAASARDTWPTGPGFEFNLAEPLQARERDSADGFSPSHRWTAERGMGPLVDRLRAYGRSRRMGLRSLTGIASIEPIAVNAVGRPTRYRVAGVGGRSWELSAESARVAMNFSGPGAPPLPRGERVMSGDFTARVIGDRVRFEGRGFGHGVGMSQYGAEGLARRGWSAPDILRHFYPGARLERAY